jgi:hypothetical protein
MAPLTVKGTSRKVTSYHASYRPNGTVVTRVATLGPRQIAAAQTELRLRRRSLFDSKHVIAMSPYLFSTAKPLD